MLRAVRQVLPWGPASSHPRGTHGAVAASSSGAATAPERTPGPASPAAGPPVQLVAVVADGAASPLKGAPWGDVLRHTADRLRWNNERFRLSVVTEASLQVGGAACWRPRLRLA